MKPEEKMERLVKRFCDAKKSSVKTGAEMDKRVLGEVFGAYDKSRTKESAASQPDIWRIIMKNRMGKVVAAAVIIAAALIGMKVLFGLGEPPTHVPVAQPPVSGAVDENWDSQVDIELKQVQRMYAEGDVKGLAAMLAGGQFQSKLLAANYLAQMQGGAEALEALENVEAEYGKDDPANPLRRRPTGLEAVSRPPVAKAARHRSQPEGSPQENAGRTKHHRG